MQSNSVTTYKHTTADTAYRIWLLDVARSLPPSTMLDGFDISLAQCPPRGWIPPNVNFKELDIFGEIPSDLQGIYDVVHIRYMVLVVKENNPLPILRNLFKLLSTFAKQNTSQSYHIS